MKIGFLIPGHVSDSLVEEFGQYDKHFERLLQGKGFECSSYMVLDDEFPTSVNDADGWLISGSRHGVYEDHAWISKLEDFVRECFANDIPIVGICFGHQLIAQAMGGHVEKFSDGWAVGNVEIEMSDGSNKRLLALHQDQVMTPPKGAITIGATNFCKHAALLYPGKALSYQPHPEFTGHYLCELLDETVGARIGPDMTAAAKASLVEHTNSEEIADEIADFFYKHAKSESKAVA